MPQERTRRIVITGILGAISIFLGITRWGFIPWFSGASLTIMHLPVIIGAIMEGPVVGLVVGLIFGVFSLVQSAVAPNGPADVIFTNPLISVLPRLLIGPAAWLAWISLKRWPIIGLIVSGVTGSLVNTALVLGVIGFLGLYPWPVLGGIFIANGFSEAAASAFLVVILLSAIRGIRVGGKARANL